MANLNIKLPESHYVTFQFRDESNCPLAFMTPYGTDEAAKKRMITADNWATGYGGHSNNLDPKIIKNEPMYGFKIAKNIQRFTTSNVVWRVEDPRGFELEVSSQNLLEIIQLCTIENGEILEPCVWGRLKGNNLLIPTVSDEYKAAIANTKRTKKIVKIGDVNIGDTVLLHNGQEGIYMGSFYLICSTERSGAFKNGYEEISIGFSKNKRHIFLLNNNKCKRIKAVASPKISEIVSVNSGLTISHAEKQINTMISNLEVNVVDGTNFRIYGLNGVTTNQSATLGLELAPTQDILQYMDERHDLAEKNNVPISTQRLIAEFDSKYYEVNSSQIIWQKRTHRQDCNGLQINIEKLKNELVFCRDYVTLYGRWNNIQYHFAEVPFAASVWIIPRLRIENNETKNIFLMDIH